jgi:outer membrane protein assembly factor BamA
MKNCCSIFRIFYSSVVISLFCIPGFSQSDSVKVNHLLVLPIVSKSIETGWSFGAVGAFTFRISRKDTLSRTSNLEALAIYSTKKQLVTAINGSQYFHHERFILSEQVSYSSYPDKFWGLGKNTPDSAEEPYKFQQYYIFLHLMRKIVPNFFVGAVYERQKLWDVEYVPGGAFDQQDVQGRNGYTISGLGGSLTYDNRNNAFAPDRGFFGQLFINHFDKFWGSDFNYTNVVVDIRKYFHLKRYQVLAMQLFSFNNSGFEIPIRSLAALGGASRMRGYFEGRYRDLRQSVFQTEYRFPVWRRFGAVLFGGTGSVASEFSDYALNDLRFSLGAGIRYALDKKERLNIRVDYGIGGGKNNGLYLQIGEAF